LKDHKFFAAFFTMSAASGGGAATSNESSKPRAIPLCALSISEACSAAPNIVSASDDSHRLTGGWDERSNTFGRNDSHRSLRIMQRRAAAELEQQQAVAAQDAVVAVAAQAAQASLQAARASEQAAAVASTGSVPVVKKRGRPKAVPLDGAAAASRPGNSAHKKLRVPAGAAATAAGEAIAGELEATAIDEGEAEEGASAYGDGGFEGGGDEAADDVVQPSIYEAVKEASV